MEDDGGLPYCCGYRSTLYSNEPLLSVVDPLANQTFEMVLVRQNYAMDSYMQVLLLRQEYLYTASFNFSRASPISGKAPSSKDQNRLIMLKRIPRHPPH
jgi:hypothetical protein